MRCNMQSLLTNLIALSLLALSFIIPVFSEQLRSTGLFALAGAITNWLAIHMLFEKVPGLYGSGIIPLRFREFKRAIYNMILEQFFSNQNLQKFLEKTNISSSLDQSKLKSLTSLIDYDLAFKQLLATVSSSPLGGMMGMFGGEAMLEPLKEPFKDKMQTAILESLEKESTQKKISAMFSSSLSPQDIREKIEAIVETRLAELTPNLVKEIIQEMIHQHLGWLVIWGGVFGGIIGFIASFF